MRIFSVTSDVVRNNGYVDSEEPNIWRPLPAVPTEHCDVYEIMPNDDQKTTSVNDANSCNTTTPDNGKPEWICFAYSWTVV